MTQLSATVRSPSDRPPASQSTPHAEGSRAPARARWAWRSDGVVAAVIGVFGLVFWVPAAVHAGFVKDDWAMVEHFALRVPFATFRPVARLDWDVSYWLFGPHPTGYYVALAVTMALIGVTFYAALRHLGLSAVPAAIAGLGIVAYPRADSLGTFWADPAAPALLLGLLSVTTGAIWVARRGPCLRWLVPTLVLMGLSVLCYEAMAPLFVLALCLAPLSPDVRRTVTAAACSAVVALGAAVYVYATEAAAHGATGIGAYAGHLRQLMSGAWQALVRHGLSTPTAVGFAFAAVTVVAIGAVLEWRGTVIVPEPWRRLLLALGLLVVGAMLSLVPFVPSGPYYEPTAPGTGNRVNALAQVFVLAFIAIAIWLGCRLAARLVGGRDALRVAVAAALVVAVVLLSGYAGYVKADQNYYNDASRQRAGYIEEIERLKPVVPRGDLVLLGDYPSQIGPPGARWFATIEDLWDASEIVSLTYGRSTMVADPLFASTQCLASSVSIQIPTGFETFPYGKVVVVDLGRDRVLRLANRAACEAALPSLIASA